MSKIKTKFIEDDAVTTAKILNANVTDAKLASTFVKANGTVPFSADQAMGGFKLTGLGTPSAGTDAATKTYADGAVNAKMVQEVPSGTINGSNTAFTLSQTPAANDWVALYLNGLYLEPTTDYTLSGTAITMVAAPVAGQKLRALYLKG